MTLARNFAAIVRSTSPGDFAAAEYRVVNRNQAAEDCLRSIPVYACPKNAGTHSAGPDELAGLPRITRFSGGSASTRQSRVSLDSRAALQSLTIARRASENVRFGTVSSQIQIVCERRWHG